MNRDLKEKGLRLCFTLLSFLRPSMNRDLKEKGLRPGSLCSVPTEHPMNRDLKEKGLRLHGANDIAPRGPMNRDLKEKGLRRTTPSRTRSPSLYEPRPEREGIKTLFRMNTSLTAAL